MKVLKPSRLKKGLRCFLYSSLTVLTLFGALAPVVGYEKQKVETQNSNPQGTIEQTISVMSANIAACAGRPFSFWDLFPNPVTEWWHGETANRGCKKLEEMIRENGITIVGLQEIEQSDVRKEDQPKLFAQHTGLSNYSFASNITHRFPGLWYLANAKAILSQAPIESSTWIPLEDKKPFSWGTIFDFLVGTEGIHHITLRYQGHLINVINVHLSNEEFIKNELDDGRLQREREIEFRAVFEYAAKVTKEGPTILLGDWNSAPPRIRFKNFSNTDGKYEGENTWETALEIVDREGLVLEHAGLLDPYGSLNMPGSYHGVVPPSELGYSSHRKDTGERIDLIFTR